MRPCPRLWIVRGPSLPHCVDRTGRRREGPRAPAAEKARTGWPAAVRDQKAPGCWSGGRARRVRSSCSRTRADRSGPRRDAGAWSIPKGLIDDGEEPLAAARRELREEVGLEVDATGDFVRLADRRLKSGKTVLAWMVGADLDLAQFRSNSFELEWPRGSGRRIVVPECDRGSLLHAVRGAREDPRLPARLHRGSRGAAQRWRRLTLAWVSGIRTIEISNSIVISATSSTKPPP